MGQSTRKTAAARGRFARHRCTMPPASDDTMEFELLRLWIGISRLHEALGEQRHWRTYKSAKSARPRNARRRLAPHRERETLRRAISFSA